MTLTKVKYCKYAPRTRQFKSGFYCWKNRKPSNHTSKRNTLKKHIYQIYIQSQKRYGSPKITQILRNKGYTVT
ncbi:IS3 family transposase [Staphylococcus rostri]|uniref:IS3 family transposase n=1 Tax=Staphylococcus rostri TaxID=522262 RepID=UPI0034A024F1